MYMDSHQSEFVTFLYGHYEISNAVTALHLVVNDQSCLV